jgi:hypothetical protein
MKGELKIARSGLDHLKAMVKLEFLAKLFGFESVAEAQSSRLGASISNWFVSCREIVNHQAGKSLRHLVVDRSEILHFVLNQDGKVKSGVWTRFSWKENMWSSGRIGTPAIAVSVDQVSRDVIEKSDLKFEDFSILHVEALALDFLIEHGTVSSKGWKVYALQNFSEPLNLAKSTAVPLKKFIELVQPIAAKACPAN